MWVVNWFPMDDNDFEKLLSRKYAQVVLYILLNAEDYSCSFSMLRDEVDAIISDDSRGTKETYKQGQYSTQTLDSVLKEAKSVGIASKYLDDGKKRWRLHPSQLSESQINKIRERNSPDRVHTDTDSVDFYFDSHTDVRDK